MNFVNSVIKIEYKKIIYNVMEFIEIEVNGIVTGKQIGRAHV